MYSFAPEYGQNYPFSPERINFWEILLKWFLPASVPYHAAKFEKILRMNPDIKACKILGHSWARIVHLNEKRVFKKFPALTFLFWFCPIIMQSLKKIVTANTVKLTLFWATIRPKFPIWAKRFWGQVLLQGFLFTYCDLSCCKIKKKQPLRGSPDTDFCNFGPE